MRGTHPPAAGPDGAYWYCPGPPTPTPGRGITLERGPCRGFIKPRHGTFPRGFRSPGPPAWPTLGRALGTRALGHPQGHPRKDPWANKMGERNGHHRIRKSDERVLGGARPPSPTVHGGRVTPDAGAPATPRPRPKVVGAGGDPLPGWVWSTVQTDAHAVWRGSPPLHGAVPQPGTQDLVDGEAGRPPRRDGVPVGRPSPDGASYRELPSAGLFPLDKI